MNTKKRSRVAQAKTRRAPRNSYDYSTQIAAVVMVKANGGNCSKVGTELGIPPATLRKWCNGKRCKHIHALADAYTGDMAKAFRDAVWTFLSIALGKAHAAPFNHLMTGTGIAFDKLQVLTGGVPPTPPPVQVNLNFAVLAPDERHQLYALLRKARPGPVVADHGPGAGDSGIGTGGLPGLPERELPDTGTGRGEPVPG